MPNNGTKKIGFQRCPKNSFDRYQHLLGEIEERKNIWIDNRSLVVTKVFEAVSKKFDSHFEVKFDMTTFPYPVILKFKDVSSQKTGTPLIKHGGVLQYSLDVNGMVS